MCLIMTKWLMILLSLLARNCASKGGVTDVASRVHVLLNLFPPVKINYIHYISSVLYRYTTLYKICGYLTITDKTMAIIPRVF